MGGDTLTIDGDACDLVLSGSLIDALPCRMDGSTLLISILDGEFPATLRMDGTLAFELDEMLIWYERVGDTPAQPTVAPTDAPAAPEAQGGGTGLNAIAEIRFVMTDADMNGYSMTPEMLGGYEYSLVFHEDGTVDFVMAGTAIPPAEVDLRQGAHCGRQRGGRHHDRLLRSAAERRAHGQGPRHGLFRQHADALCSRGTVTVSRAVLQATRRAYLQRL